MHIYAAIWFIKLGVAITMIAFGIHQARYPEKWLRFLPNALRKTHVLKPTATMRAHALGNILIGLLLLFPLYSLVSGWIALIWWLSVIPFAWKEDWQIGLRDLSIAASLGAMITLLS
jgi:hypothetical protein